MEEYLNDPQGARFWQVHFGGEPKTEFGEFSAAMSRHFQKKINPKDRARLRSSVDFTGNGIVSVPDFKKFLSICGPFESEL